MKTIKDAPAQLNTNDKAMWVLGYNQALADRAADANYVRECAITLSNFAIGKGMVAPLAAIASRMEGIVEPQRWAVYCPVCRSEWSVDYPHPGKQVCEACTQAGD